MSRDLQQGFIGASKLPVCLVVAHYGQKNRFPENSSARSNDRNVDVLIASGAGAARVPYTPANRRVSGRVRSSSSGCVGAMPAAGHEHLTAEPSNMQTSLRVDADFFADTLG